RRAERHLRGVDVVVGTVNEASLDIHDRIAGLTARLQRLLDALVHRVDELARDGATDDGVLELVARAALLRLELDHNMRELTATAGLALVRHIHLHRSGDGLAIGDLRPANVRLNPELPHHAVDHDLEVKLAHAVEDDLTGLLVCADAERR